MRDDARFCPADTWGRVQTAGGRNSPVGVGQNFMLTDINSAPSGRARKSDDLRHAMSPFSFFLSAFSGVQRILGYLRPWRMVAVHPPGTGSRRSLWRSFRLGQTADAPLKDAELNCVCLYFPSVSFAAAFPRLVMKENCREAAAGDSGARKAECFVTFLRSFSPEWSSTRYEY